MAGMVIMMINGETVTVIRPTKTGVDALNNPVYGEPTREVVSNVLIAPGGTSDFEAARPEGVTVSCTLHFPKTYTDDLEGCSVELPAPWAGTYHVIGKAQPYIDENTPGLWDRQCEVTAAHG